MGAGGQILGWEGGEPNTWLGACIGVRGANDWVRLVCSTDCPSYITMATGC